MKWWALIRDKSSKPGEWPGSGPYEESAVEGFFRSMEAAKAYAVRSQLSLYSIIPGELVWTPYSPSQPSLQASPLPQEPSSSGSEGQGAP